MPVAFTGIDVARSNRIAVIDTGKKRELIVGLEFKARPGRRQRIDGAGGYWINQDDSLGDKNYWFVGWLLQRKITEKLTLGGEIFYQTADAVDGKDSTGFSVGGTYDFDDHNHLLFSAGPGIQNASDSNLFSWYLGWQVNY